MLRNYVITALRNLVRNRLYAAINIIGLAVGFAAALLIALYVRDEFSYDRWIPGHERIHRITTLTSLNSLSAREANSPPDIAAWLRLAYPAIAPVARLYPDRTNVRHDGIEGPESIFWADPDFFLIFRLPALSGDVAASLEAADGVVVTRRIARKYFGRDDV